MSTATASTATTVPAPMPDDGVLKGVFARTSDRETLERFSAQGEGCGWCSHPIRLVGSQATVDRDTGEIVRTYSTASEPDGVLLKACGTRRATRCPSCAATYAADARMLVRSGLSGGKGVPRSVASHPMVFATFTAPSFGAVHGVRSGGGTHPCRPGVRGRRCAHGRPVACWARHGSDDQVLGEPLCVDCYDYEHAVLWNASCPALWHRTTIAVKRELARLLGVSTRELSSLVRVSFAKVAEYQSRGTIHLHAVIRLDAADCDAPLLEVDAATLAAAIRLAAAKVVVSFPAGFSGLVRWGSQIDVRAITSRQQLVAPDRDQGRDSRKSVAAGARAVANYVAKYATKSTDGAGALDRRLHGLEDLDIRGVTGHLRRLVETAWRLGARPDLPRLRAWAHTLGFGGHWLTKSRRYSVTFASLRAERQGWRIGRQAGRSVDPSQTVTMSTWEWAGTGWRTRGDAWLAAIGQKARAQSRLEARDALCLERIGSAWSVPVSANPAGWERWP
ncbi:MAG: replication initiator [Acidimicrobiales bacterium]